MKVGAKVVRHGRYITFQLAEVAIPRSLFANILRRIQAPAGAQFDTGILSQGHRRCTEPRGGGGVEGPEGLSRADGALSRHFNRRQMRHPDQAFLRQAQNVLGDNIRVHVGEVAYDIVGIEQRRVMRIKPVSQ